MTSTPEGRLEQLGYDMRGLALCLNKARSNHDVDITMMKMAMWHACNTIEECLEKIRSRDGQ